MISIRSLPQFRRNAARFREIVTVLAKYGLADWLKEGDPGFFDKLFQSAQGVRLSSMSREARVRTALTDLGTTFIKLGQVLSTRPDLVGPALAEELAHLQTRTPPDPPETVRAIILEELGQPVDELYAAFDDTPIASASIGQVHAATLHDGRDVVVKVQHPGIGDVVARDLDILEALAWLAERHSADARLYQPSAAVDDFRRAITRELDFTRERRNLEQFTRSFADDDTIRFPQPVPERSSTRVLTMERFDGFSVGDVDRLVREGHDRTEIAKRGANAYLDMVFRDGVYHADPHPGNILILPDGVLGLIDFGMVGRVDEVLRDALEDVIVALASADTDQLTQAVLRIGILPDQLERDALRTNISEFVGDFLGVPIDELDLSGALNGVTDIIRRHRIVLPSGVAMIIRVLIMLEGTSRSLSRDFSLAELIKPYQHTMLRRRLSPDRLKRQLMRRARDWERLLEMLPRELATLLERARQGRLDVNLTHRGLEPTVNRLVWGILVAALFLGSSMLWSNGVKPTLFGVSIFGATGCVLAFASGAWLLRSIRKSGGLTRHE